MLPYGRQSIDEDDISAVVQVLKSDWLTTGPMIERFEAAVAQHCSARHGVAVANGTAALHAALFAIDLGPGDEVIVPAITFAATANAVLYQRGTPVFADVDANTMLVNADDVASKITSRTKAIVAVDFAGTPCDYERLRSIASRNGVVLIADACHSLGATYCGQPVGSLADLTCFSFHPVKPITTGEGGLVTTNNEAWAARMRQFRGHGISSDFRQRNSANLHDYDMSELGFNYRITDFQAALGISQLEKLSRFAVRRTELAQAYSTRFADSSICSPLHQPQNRQSAWHLYVVHWNAGSTGISRDEAFQRLRMNGIGANVHYKPVYRHSYYRDVLGYKAGLCPQAEQAYQSCLTLPLFVGMTFCDVASVADRCKEIGLGTTIAKFRRAA